MGFYNFLCEWEPLYTVIVLFLILILYLVLGSLRHQEVLYDMRQLTYKVKDLSDRIANNQQSAISRDKSLRSLLSKNHGQLATSLNNNFDRVSCLEDIVVNEIKSSAGMIQNRIQQSHSGLSNSLKSKIDGLYSELVEIQNFVSQLKDDILQTQSKSFGSMESKLTETVQNEHEFIADQFNSARSEHSSLSASIQEVANVMREHLDSLKPLEYLFERLNSLCNELVLLDKVILNQENSLTSMVDKHLQIVEYTQDIQKTSKDIFDLMKLILMESVVRRTDTRVKKGQ